MAQTKPTSSRASAAITLGLGLLLLVSAQNHAARIVRRILDVVGGILDPAGRVHVRRIGRHGRLDRRVSRMQLVPRDAAREREEQEKRPVLPRS